MGVPRPRKITALLMRVNEQDELFQYDPTDHASLTLLQEMIGGYLEAAPIILPELTMYCNEEGKRLRLPPNNRASDMLGPHNPDWIAGDVIIVGRPDKEGYDTSIPQAYQDVVR